MQITMPRGELKAACGGFTKIVNGKTTLPILGGVRFANNGHGITAQVTDLDQHLRYRFSAAQAQSDGAFVVPLVALKELAKGSDKETVEFETGADNSITVTNHIGSQAIRHPVQGLDPDEWPACPPDVATKPAEGFLETYRRLVPFASTDTSRYVLNSVYVEVADRGEHPVTMVATDGRRLSLWNTMNLPLEKSVIVPTTKFLQWNGLQSGEESLGLRTERPKKEKGKEAELHVLSMTLSVGPWPYDVKAVDGTYPNFRQVVPSDQDAANRIVFTDADVAALKKIMPGFPGANTNSAMIALRPGAEGKLVIGGRGADDKDETRLELTGGSRFEGKLQGFGVNAGFLLDALNAGFRTFTAVDELCPLKSEDGRGGTHILMPMRLGTEAVKKSEPVSTPETGNGVAATPEPEAPQGETTTPAQPPAAEDHKPKGSRKTMNKENNGNGTTEQGSALDKVLTAVETAKGKLREAASALVEVSDAVKTAHKEGRAQAADLDKARTTLQKLQAISL
jgi:DNA polymerase III sliding clamp (beta) subunit (PCNA family)